MKRVIKALILSAAMLFVTACEPISQLPPGYDSVPDGTVSSDKGDVTETEETAVEYTEYVAELPEITSHETSIKIEAEDCKIGGSLYIADEKKGFSGEGYVTGFYGGSADYLVFEADIPATQHYDITICAASDQKASSNISVGDLDLAPFSLEGDGKFVRITMHGVFMSEGKASIRVNHGNENFAVDYIEISDNQDVYEEDFEIENKPVTEGSSFETKALMRFLEESFGEEIITGQYVSGKDNRELELIHDITGKYPAIRFSDIGEYAQATVPSDREIEAAMEWDSRGGIVGFMWHWNAPCSEPSIYAKDTDFSLQAAVTDTQVWDLSIAELTELYTKDKISLECLSLIKDIDNVAEGLDLLSQENIPVLWRPLHEAGGGWYWWGASGPDAYRWLYDLMYKRLTEYHKLDNLIWIWSGQSEEYMVDSSEYDIAALDIYLSPNAVYGSRSEQFRWLRSVTKGKKLLAIGECSTIPGIDEMLRDKSMWSFFGLWFGDYIEDSQGGLSEIYNKKEDLIRVYNAENSITLENYSGMYGLG